jgi:hypothetical protein
MESIGFTCNIFFMANFHVLGPFMPKTCFGRKKFPSVTWRLMHEIFTDDISATLSATELRFLLPFNIWAGMMHRILKILNF